jgi:hypothetical protein
MKSGVDWKFVDCISRIKITHIIDIDILQDMADDEILVELFVVRIAS